MSISSEVRRAGPYAGNGSTVAFAFAFKVFSTAQVRVTRTTSGTEAVLTLTTDYSVSLNANQDTNPGGTVTMVTAPTTAQTITITSNVANTQPTAIANLGAFYPEVINDSLDRATIQIQQLDERLDRSLNIPVSSTGISTELPTPVAATLIGWNTAGTGLVNYPSALADAFPNFARLSIANTFTAQQTFTGASEPIVVNRTTNPSYSIVMKDNGTIRGYLGVTSGYPLRVSNPSGTYALSVADNGSVNIQGDLGLGAGSGICGIDINGGIVASIRYYSASSARWAVGYAAGTGSGNNFEFYSYGSSTTAMSLDYTTNHLTVNGTVRPVGASTTASAANAFMNSGDGNALLRSTSSRRYKTDIEPLDAAYAQRVLSLEPVWYRSTSEADKADWSWYGLIAEDVATIEPRLVHWMQDGDELIPDGVQYERLAVLLLSVVKQMRAELNALQAEKAVTVTQPTEPTVPDEFLSFAEPDESVADLKTRLLTELTRLRSMAVGRLEMTDRERSMLTQLESQVAQRWFSS